MTDPLATTLAHLSDQTDPAAPAGRWFDTLSRGRRRVVIFGTGQLGRIALEGARGAGLDILAFADNNPALAGQLVEGVPVLPPTQAVDAFDRIACFIVAIFNGSQPRAQLAALGASAIVPYPAFYWKYPEAMPSMPHLELPDQVLADPAAIERGYRCLADERSRTEFAAQIAWRCTLDYRCLPQADPHAEMYFAPDLVAPGPGEIFVDCGAFDGDSIRAFLAVTENRFERILAIEPDAVNRARLGAWIAGQPPEQAERIAVLPFGLGDTAERVGFASTGTVATHRTVATGDQSIEIRRLDDLLAAERPSFIKMDIEGAEPAAIRGAAGVLARHRPIVAACAYHRGEHLWTLPRLLADAVPDYRIYLRRYAEECWETVYYAIPPERVLAGA